MLYIAYGSLCKLEMQALLAGDFGFIDTGHLETVKKRIAEVERMLKSLHKIGEELYFIMPHFQDQESVYTPQFFGDKSTKNHYMIFFIPLTAWLIRMLFSIRAKRT